MKVRYSIEPKGFLSFAKNFGTHTSKVAKNMSNKYSQFLLDSAQKSTTDAIKTASERAIQKTAEATDDLIDNKMLDEMTIISKSSQNSDCILI